jgi:predicted CXXCH cytochrome family protein
MSNTKRSWFIFLIGAGLTLILAGLSPLVIAYAQEATPEASAEAVENEPQPEATRESIYEITVPPETITGNNSYCLVCHNQPWDTVTLPDGSIQNLFVNPNTIASSVHGANSSTGTFGCVDCHGEDRFPHNDPSPTDDRAYTLDSVSICASCHTEEVEALQIGLHEQAILDGNREAAVCTDCHGAHDVQPVVEEPDLIAGICGECHTTTLAEWRVSDHVDIGPLGCVTCHSPHSQRLRAGNDSDELCINCHEDVSNVFVHDQHLEGEAPIDCIDCHMDREEQPAQLISVVGTNQSTGHSMLLDATPCNTCHEELVTSGEWDQLIADRAPVETAPIEAPPTEVAAETVVDTSSQSYVQLLQGLILGLGFGATVAAVFVSRGNHSTTVVEAVPLPPDVTTSEVPAAQDSTPTSVPNGDQGESDEPTRE